MNYSELKPNDFLAGINIEGNDVRDFPEKIVEILKATEIKWIRVHQLPNRILDKKGNNGLSYLDGIKHLCKNGYNIMAPIEVGMKTNVGIIDFDEIDDLVEQSYDESFNACKKISEVVRRYNKKIIFGIENEIDPKAWIVQSLPGFEWRKQFETWIKLALDYKLKYKRLKNILKGVLDADSEAKTITNVVAEDIRFFFRNFKDELNKITTILNKYSISLEDTIDNLIDWKTELRHINHNLDVDYIGLDNYPNMILKYPVHGQYLGEKVAEATSLTGKPVLNVEFGYTTYRTLLGKLLFYLLRRPSASKMQLQFFQNSLESIAKSTSIGTFPWVLISHPHYHANPIQENYFGLIKMDKIDQLTKEPSFDYYVNWLKTR